MPIETTEQAKVKVYQWMEDRKIFNKEIKSDEVDFQYEGITETQITVTIAKPKKLAKSIVLVTRIEIHPKHSEVLSVLDPQKRADLIWYLKESLIFAPATFTMESPGNNLKSIQFAKEISFDELTDGRLIEALDNVCRCLIWTAWVLVENLGSPLEEVHHE